MIGIIALILVNIRHQLRKIIANATGCFAWLMLKNLNTLLSFMKKDKKNNTRKINLVLLKKVGSPVYKLQFNEKTINLFLKKELTK